MVFPKEGAQGGPFVLGMEIDEEIKKMSWVQTMRKQTLLVAADRHIPNYSMRQVRQSRGNEAQSVSIWGRGVQPQPQPERGRSACYRDILGPARPRRLTLQKAWTPLRKGSFTELRQLTPNRSRS